MELKINAKELERGLAKAAVFTPKKPSVQILESVLLTVTATEAYLTATDMDSYIRISLSSAGLNEPGDVIIENPAKVASALKYFEFVTVSVPEGKLVLRGEGKELEQSVGEEAKDFPDFPDIDGREITISAKRLTDRVNTVSYAAAKNNITPVLEGIIFDGNNIFALDGYRVALSTDDTADFGSKFVIFKSVMDKIIKTLDGADVTVKVGDKFASFISGNTIAVARLIDGKTFDLCRLLDDHRADSKFNIDRESLEAAAAYLDAPAVDWRGRELSAADKSSRRKAEVDSLDNIDILVNSAYLKDALKQFKRHKEITISYRSGLEPLIITSEEMDGALALVLPMRRR
jgi:DNA polymerase III sliding clamp (beta) subunit (PCNA family)